MSGLLSRLIDEAAQRRPEAPAVRCHGETLTYEQLALRSNGLARVLSDTGAKRGARIAVLLRKSLDVPVSFYGVLASGGALVPIDPKSPASQVVRILQATGATHLISEPARQDVVREAIPVCPLLEGAVGVDLGEESAVRSTAWSVVAESASERGPATAATDLDPAYILHTSGSTGTPKLIPHTHRSAMSFAEWAVREYSLGPGDRLSNHSSHHTCFATFDFYAAARAGATTVLVTPAESMMPSSLAALMEEERLSVWYSVPTALVHLSLRGHLEARDLGKLRWVLFAGETFPHKHLRRLVRQLPGARFSHVYGSTETNICTYHHLSKADHPEDPLPIGRACDTAEVLVVDDQVRPVADGEPGELLVRGSTVMSGYWGDPDADRAFVRPAGADGAESLYFRTGDRVRRREDGNLVFVARTDSQIKVRGHRIELEEVETALLSLDPVEEAAAVTVEDAEGDASLRAAVVVTAGDAEPAAGLRAGLSRLLPPAAVPAEISVFARLPRTPTGKVDRAAVRALLTRQEAPS